MGRKNKRNYQRWKLWRPNKLLFVRPFKHVGSRPDLAQYGASLFTNSPSSFNSDYCVETTPSRRRNLFCVYSSAGDPKYSLSLSTVILWGHQMKSIAPEEIFSLNSSICVDMILEILVSNWIRKFNLGSIIYLGTIVPWFGVWLSLQLRFFFNWSFFPPYL